MKYSANRSTCMWVSQFVSWANVHAKQFHACGNSEIETKTKVDLGLASVYVNDRKHSNKSSKKYSHKRKHKSDINAAQGIGSGLTQKQLS